MGAVVVALAACSPLPDAGGTRPPATEAGAAPSSSPSSATKSAPPTVEALAWGPSRQQYDDAASAVERMSTEQLAGQVMVGFYAGVDSAQQERAIRELYLAGTIIMGDNVPTAADGSVDTAAMAEVSQGFHDAVAADGRDWPAVVSVDQEGGAVARLRAPLTVWPAPMTYGAAGSTDLVRASMTAMTAELAGLGFTMNHAPSADVTAGVTDPTIGARSFSAAPAVVAELAGAAVEGVLDAGVLPSLKHFPGHGSVPTDSHLDLPVQPASLKQLKDRDWIPFKAGAAEVPVVMMGHIAVDALDPGVPSSVSAPNYAALRELGFEGVAITDALNMAAIEQQYPGGQAAPLALAAGADLLLMPTDSYAAHAAVVAAVEAGDLPEERLREAATRVVTLMKWQQELASGAGAAEPGAGAAQSRAASAAGVTVMTGQCSGDLLDGSVSVTGGTESDRMLFTAAAEARGLSVGAGGTRVALVGADGAPPLPADIAVALDAPWWLDGADAPVQIGLFGNSPGAFEALLDVLTGAAGAPGTLPVSTAAFEAGTGCG